MSSEELTMLRCLVEYISEASGNDYVYANTTDEAVSLESCKRWLYSELYKAEDC